MNRRFALTLTIIKNYKTFESNSKLANEGNHEGLQTIDVLDEIEEDLDHLEKLAIIYRFISTRLERKKIINWLEETWQTPLITKFIPAKGVFYRYICLRRRTRENIAG